MTYWHWTLSNSIKHTAACAVCTLVEEQNRPYRGDVQLYAMYGGNEHGSQKPAVCFPSAVPWLVFHKLTLCWGPLPWVTAATPWYSLSVSVQLHANSFTMWRKLDRPVQSINASFTMIGQSQSTGEVSQQSGRYCANFHPLLFSLSASSFRALLLCRQLTILTTSCWPSSASVKLISLLINLPYLMLDV